MKKLLAGILMICLSVGNTFAQENSEESLELTVEQKVLLERLGKIKFQEGTIDFGHDIELTIPEGYKFINAADAKFIVVDLWGNSKDANVSGMLVKDGFSPLDDSSWSFVASYDDCGYIKDEDANKIDYDDLMKDIQSDEKEVNAQREKAGIGAVHMLGWASKPYYDKTNKILHWAKSLKFDKSEDTTLNYDVRILGRKGLLSLNAVGSISELPDVQKHIPDIIKIAKFKKGASYLDFNASTDKVAAYTIGGLVAGKVLAKAGLFALLLKNIKLVVLAALGVFAGLRNKIAGWFGRKSNNEVE